MAEKWLQSKYKIDMTPYFISNFMISALRHLKACQYVIEAVCVHLV
jgi:hypothetical protein